MNCHCKTRSFVMFGRIFGLRPFIIIVTYPFKVSLNAIVLTLSETITTFVGENRKVINTTESILEEMKRKKGLVKLISKVLKSALIGDVVGLHDGSDDAFYWLFIFNTQLVCIFSRNIFFHKSRYLYILIAGT